MKTTNHIRVFISSTFKDMQDERDILVKKIFPRLRVEAEKRGLIFSYVDLRWGVVPNAKPKEIIDVCLSEIENCDPFFIGLIGHNYGSMIPSVNQSEKSVLDEHHKGMVTELLQKKLGYTELEMQYNLLYSKERANNYFYIKEGKTSSTKSCNRGCLASFIPTSLLLLKDKVFESENNNNPLDDLKAFVLNNYPDTTSYYPEDTTYKNSECFEKEVFSDFTTIIEDYAIPQDIETKSVRYHQEAFLEKQKDLIPRNDILNKMEEWAHQDNVTEKGCTKLLILKGELGSGKTSIIARFLNQQHQIINIIYHFVGASLKRETPELILRDLIAQVCSCLNLEEPKYTGDETKDDLCKQLKQFVQNTDKEIVIVLDDLEAIECDTDSLMSIITWLPTGVNNLKYIVSIGLNLILFQKCPEWIQKEELLVDSLTPTECYIFSKEYLLKKYSKNIEGEYGENNEILTPKFYSKPNKQFLRNLGLLKLFLDEVAMLDFGKDKNGLELVNQIEEKSRGRHVVLSLPFARIEKDIFGEEKAKAEKILSFLTISDFGLYENDIVTICSNQDIQITQVDWSKLYCQIKPFIISDGYIKLNEEIRNILCSRYLWKKEKRDTLRIELAKQLEQLNTSNQYSQEIIRQYLKVGDCSSLKRVLSSPQLATYIYCENKDLLFDSLKFLKTHNLTNYLAEELMTAISKYNKDEKLSIYEVISEVFSETLPIYGVAINAINKAIDIQESNNHKDLEDLKQLANNYLKRTRLLTTVYKLEDAHKSIDDFFVLLNKNKELSSDTSLYVKGLITRAKIYTHHPSIKENQKAFPLYREALEKSDKEDVIDYVILLHDFIMLCGYYLHNKDEVAHYFQIMHAYIMDNTISGTLSYYKALLYYMEIGILKIELSGTNIDDYNIFVKDLIAIFQEYTELYGKLTRDTAAFCCIIGDICYNIAQMYYRQNKYNDYVHHSDRAVQYYELYADSVDKIFDKDTKTYANSLHQLARGYQSFVETRPMEKEMIIQKCLSWYSEEKNILNQLFPEGHWDLAKLYHNISSLYKDINDFDKAKEYIEKAIKMKQILINKNERSIHDSYVRKLIIYKTELIEKDIHMVEPMIDFQNQINELLSITDNLDLMKEERDYRKQEISNYQTWLDKWQKEEKGCYLKQALAVFEVAKKMITDYQVRKLDKEEEVTKLLLKLFLQWDKLDSYITIHHLKADFDNNMEYNSFKSLVSQIQNVLSR